MDVAEKAIECRSVSDMYRGESFGMIAGYKGHGAIVHYSASPESASTLNAEGLLLVDCGGQYLDGTTDITRTMSLGNPTASEKHDYTLVLKGHLAIGRAIFPVGTRGSQLDALARIYQWQEMMTYLHGTGHGVGHFLGVHEGPQNIRLNENPTTLKPGMITSNEPGLYKAGQYGIRTENLVLTVPAGHSEEFGDFLKFETLTLFPYDKNLIDLTMLSAEEVAQVNAYHAEVRSRLTPYLNEEEQAWLNARTEAI
jgi:Xaa-Pro aminopeptidase